MTWISNTRTKMFFPKRSYAADVTLPTPYLVAFYINDWSREWWHCGQTRRDHFISQSKETNYIWAEQHSLIRPSQSPKQPGSHCRPQAGSRIQSRISPHRKKKQKKQSLGKRVRRRRGRSKHKHDNDEPGATPTAAVSLHEEGETWSW